MNHVSAKWLALILGVTVVAFLGQAQADKAKGDPLDGKRFRSVKELEGGLTPNGPLRMHWTISFGNGKYKRSYADISEEGTYEYNPQTNTVTGFVSGNRKHQWQGKYDPKTGLFTLEEVEYEQEKEQEKK